MSEQDNHFRLVRQKRLHDAFGCMFAIADRVTDQPSNTIAPA